MAFQKARSRRHQGLFPGFIELATAIEKVPSGERWLHEIKFDGYRVQITHSDGAPRSEYLLRYK